MALKSCDIVSMFIIYGVVKYVIGFKGKFSSIVHCGKNVPPLGLNAIRSIVACTACTYAASCVGILL